MTYEIDMLENLSNPTQSLVSEGILASELTLLSPAESLFQEGVEIGQEFEGKLASAVDEFYSRAIPFGERVWKQRPWEDGKYKAEFYNEDSKLALAKFLRASFSNRGEGTAAQQASIVSMMVENGWGPEKVLGAKFKHLTRLASNIKHFSREEVSDLLDLARAGVKYRSYEAHIISAREHRHYDPVRDKMISGSESAIQIIDSFCRAAKDAGDNRLQGEIISDHLGEIQYTTPGFSFSSHFLSVQICKFFSEFWRTLDPTLSTKSDHEIWATVFSGVLSEYLEQMPDEMRLRFEKLQAEFYGNKAILDTDLG